MTNGREAAQRIADLFTEIERTHDIGGPLDPRDDEAVVGLISLTPEDRGMYDVRWNGTDAFEVRQVEE